MAHCHLQKVARRGISRRWAFFFPSKKARGSETDVTRRKWRPRVPQASNYRSIGVFIRILSMGSPLTPEYRLCHLNDEKFFDAALPFLGECVEGKGFHAFFFTSGLGEEIFEAFLFKAKIVNSFIEIIIFTFFLVSELRVL